MILADQISAAFAAHADPARALQQARYLKTDMPFYGLTAPVRRGLLRALFADHPPTDATEWRALVVELWALPQREEKYAAVQACYAWRRRYVTPAHLPLFEQLIREGAWWDLVDEVASKLVSPLRRAHRAQLTPIMDQWLRDASLWVRRAALLSQLKHRTDTDAAWLFDACLLLKDEPDFFIRKAIGWALRDYSWHAPEAVARFLEAHREGLSKLSWREGAKHLIKVGVL